MINLDNTELVLFDFDDTLCIHKNHKDTEDEEHKYNVNILRHGTYTWKDCDINIHMKEFIQQCIDRDIRMGLISATMSYLHAQEKHDWVLENYGIDLENYCVGTFEGKFKMMLAISDAYSIQRERILIVDDLYENLDRAANAGFSACTPMEVVNYIEKIRNKLE